MEEKVKMSVESRLCSQIRKEWSDQRKRFAMARIAKGVVEECWSYVGVKTRKLCVVTVIPGEGDAYVTIETFPPSDAWSFDIPVVVVGAWLSRAIPHVGYDQEAVAKTLAIRMWETYQRGGLPAPSKPAVPVVKIPSSLFEYCHETIPARCAAVR